MPISLRFIPFILGETLPRRLFLSVVAEFELVWLLIISLEVIVFIGMVTTFFVLAELAEDT